MDLHIKKMSPAHPAFVEMAAEFREQKSELVGLFLVNQHLRVIIALEGNPPLLHLSVSHPRRHPTWEEMRDIRYALLPDDKTFGILLPPKEQYVNLHEHCFHMHEVPSVHEEPRRIITL